MATVALATLITRARKLLLDEPYEDYLTAAMTDGTGTAATVNNPTAWTEGDTIEVRDATLEQMKVRVGGTNPLTIKRGHNDTAGAAHSNSAVLLKNPRFSGDELNEGLTRVCLNAWPQAWTVKSTTIVPVSGITTYAAPADAMDLVTVSQDITPVGSPTQLLNFYYGPGSGGYPVLFQTNVPTSISATSQALYFPTFRSLVNPINITYRSQLDTTLIAEGTMADCFVFGACARVLGMRQVQRSGADLRQAEPGMASVYLQDVAYFSSEYNKLLRNVYIQLLDQLDGPMPLWRR